MKFERNLCRRLTVILPVKTRPLYTLRWLDYAEKTNFPFRILIADGSGGKALQKAMKARLRSTSLDITYYRYPYDSTLLRFYKKMVSAVSRCKTPFVAMTDNDALLVPEGICKSLSFLLKNRDYSTCRGQHIDFKLMSKEKPCIPLQGETLEVQHLYFNKKHSIWRSFEHPDPLTRISEWSHATNITFYNVHSRENILQAFRFLEKKRVSDIFMCDIILSLIALSRGKTRVLDTPYMLRQQNSPEGESGRARAKSDIFSRMFDETWAASVNRLARLVAENARAQKNADIKKTTAAVLSSMIKHYGDRVYLHLAQQKRNSFDGLGSEEFVHKPGSKIRNFQSAWSPQISFLTKSKKSG